MSRRPFGDSATARWSMVLRDDAKPAAEEGGPSGQHLEADSQKGVILRNGKQKRIPRRKESFFGTELGCGPRQSESFFGTASPSGVQKSLRALRRASQRAACVPFGEQATSPGSKRSSLRRASELVRRAANLSGAAAALRFSGWMAQLRSSSDDHRGYSLARQVDGLRNIDWNWPACSSEQVDQHHCKARHGIILSRVKKPKGASSRQWWQHRRFATDSLAAQCPEVE